MSHRHLPAAVFLICVFFGFSVGLEADGQSTDGVDWTSPDWELPWGLSWPDPASSALAGEGEPALADASSGADGARAAEDAAADVVASAGPEPPESPAGPGIFPGLVHPSEVSPAPAAAATAPEPSEDGGGSAIAAQLAQLEVLEAQLRTMTEASQAAREAMEAALAGVAAEPQEPVTEAQISQSLALLTDMVKKMKPSKAAELLQQWDDRLAIGIVRRLGSRRATPILSKMPAVESGRLTSKIAAGVGALPAMTAEGAKSPPQGEVE